MQIAIIGTGNIGSTLARHWRAAGHELTLGSRDPSDAGSRALAEEVGANVATPADAVRAAEVVVLAIPGGAVVATVREHADALDGRIVIVPANQLQGGSGNLARDVAEAAPGAAVVRAFNTIPFELIASGRIGDEQVDLLYAAAESADPVARQLITECGLRAIRVGDVEQAAHLDDLFALWARLAFGGGYGRGIAFALRGA